MQRMSRVGRKSEISRVLYQEFKRNPKGRMTIGQIAKRMGGKSSSNLRDIARELWEEDENVCMSIIEDIRVWWWSPMKQVELPERFITINGNKHKVAPWVADMREYKNA